MYRKHSVFVYGTLKRGFPNHFFLERATFLGAGRTSAKYALYEGEYPFVIKDEAVSRIAGEVYEVDDVTLARLDQLEQHPDFYRREQAEVMLTSGFLVTAWVYFFPRPEGVLVPSGDWRPAMPSAPDPADGGG